ncbi:MAG: hypothetical protein ACHQ2E_12350, partial [Gemmatimonadales bacterium]
MSPNRPVVALVLACGLILGACWSAGESPPSPASAAAPAATVPRAGVLGVPLVRAPAALGPVEA